MLRRLCYSPGEQARPGFAHGIMIIFQSTHLVGGETAFPGRLPGSRCNFNPLAPCGARLLPSVLCGWLRNFNPLTPCGVRPSLPCNNSPSHFQSTRPVQGETEEIQDMFCTSYFSIHSPCAIARHSMVSPTKDPFNISIHSPRTGRDMTVSYFGSKNDVSIHSPLMG